jgi:hypothetical protein
VVFVEGEKDADRLWATGIAATTTPQGAGKWRDEYAQQLVDAAIQEVVVIPDNDEPGRRHAHVAAAAMRRAGLVVRMLELDGVPAKGDVSDWLDAGHTATELVMLMDEAPIYEAPATSPAAPTTNPLAGPILVRLSDVAPEHVSWLWPRRIAVGKLTVLFGDPGLGKSYVTHDITARMTTGAEWPDGGRAPLTNVLELNAEDGAADTVVPRLGRLGADLARVSILKAVRRVEGGDAVFSLEQDLAALEQAIGDTGAGVVVVDPLVAYLGSRDSYKDAEVRAVLAPLAELAERRRTAVVAVMHPKKGQARLIHQAGGSVAFVAAARVVLAVGADPEREGRRLLVSVKNNISEPAASLAFRIDDTGLHWEPDPVAGVPEQLLERDEPMTRTERRERADAAAFLRDLLHAGPVASKQVEADAKANGFSQRTLWRARADLGILPQRATTQDGKAVWYWMLPVDGR